tara:strand:- start:3 stop:329 length:327 start_codon:yes stop_codon:yes gene_type:complete
MGPIPVKASKAKPIGVLIWLKKGGPTEILSPLNHSVITGNNVPQNTAKHITTKIKLLNKNPLSLDETDSIFLGDFKTVIRENINPKELARIIKTKDKNTGPSEDSVKE